MWRHECNNPRLSPTWKSTNNENQPRPSPTQQGPNHQWEQQLQEQRNKNYEMFGGGVMPMEHGTK